MIIYGSGAFSVAQMQAATSRSNGSRSIANRGKKICTRDSFNTEFLRTRTRKDHCWTVQSRGVRTIGGQEVFARNPLWQGVPAIWYANLRQFALAYLAVTSSVELWLESLAATRCWMRRVQQHTNQHTKTLSPDDRRRLLRVMLPSRTGGGTGGGIPRRCFSRVCPAARYFIFKKK